MKKKINLSKKQFKELLKRKNVVGYSKTLKKKISKDKEEDRECVRIYVTKKELVSCLSTEDVIPETIKINDNEEVCTDVVEVGELKALSIVPQPGSSSAHKDCTACTTNLKFKDNVDGENVVASNNHCYALENKASIHDAILCPSPYDGGRYPIDIVGRLKKYVEIKFNEFTCPYRNFFHRLAKIGSEVSENRVDIAFRTQENWDNWSDDVIQIGVVKGKTLPSIGELAFKYGRTTNYTDNGKIIDLDYEGYIGYSRGQVLFTDCILIQRTKFSQGGDSGSPVFVGDNLYIGALFAGSDTHTIVCKISNIEIDGHVELEVPWV